MLCGQIIAVCSQIHIKHISTLCGQKGELLNVKLGGKYSNHKALRGRTFPLQLRDLVTFAACSCCAVQLFVRLHTARIYNRVSGHFIPPLISFDSSLCPHTHQTVSTY
jgi:hypothetical protein